MSSRRLTHLVVSAFATTRVSSWAHTTVVTGVVTIDRAPARWPPRRFPEGSAGGNTRRPTLAATVVKPVVATFGAVVAPV